MDILAPFRSHMIDVNIIRNGDKIATVKGLKNSVKNGSRKMFNFYPDVDVKSGDWIEIPGTQFKYLVEEVEPQTFQGKICDINAYFLSPEESERRARSNAQTVYNIQSATNSIIGNQDFASITVDGGLADLQRAIEDSHSEEKEQLEELKNMLQSIIDNNIPVSKGTFARFGEALKKNSWAFSLVSKILIAWITKQPNS